MDNFAVEALRDELSFNKFPQYVNKLLEDLALQAAYKSQMSTNFLIIIFLAPSIIFHSLKVDVFNGFQERLNKDVILC